MGRRLASVAVGLWLGLSTLPSAAWGQVSTPVGQPTFRSGVSLVAVAAVVRDRQGRLVSALGRDQFEVFDRGEPRRIVEFRPDRAPLTVALLVDMSGSMAVGAKLEIAQRAAATMLTWLQAAGDQVALFGFDTRLEELQGFSQLKADVQRSLQGLTAFGMTSLHDAIAEAARRVAAHGGSHRAVIVLTDGVDTSSRLTPAEVSGMAAAIDVPVYVLAVASPLDLPELAATIASARARPSTSGSLVNLAEWTGGTLSAACSVDETLGAAWEMIRELRHQYILAFEPGREPGWHPLEVRVRSNRFTVRARSGYLAAEAR